MCDDIKQICYSNICTKRCGSCGHNQVCLSGFCLSQCHNGKYLGWHHHKFIHPVFRCWVYQPLVTDSQCMSWEACVAGTCKPPCSDHHPCPHWFTCVNGFCHVTCESSSDCDPSSSSHICYHGKRGQKVSGMAGICVPHYPSPHYHVGIRR